MGFTLYSRQTGRIKKFIGSKAGFSKFCLTSSATADLLLCRGHHISSDVTNVSATTPFHSMKKRFCSEQFREIWQQITAR